MDLMDDFFQDLSQEVTKDFTDVTTRAVWGEGLKATDAGLTLRNGLPKQPTDPDVDFDLDQPLLAEASEAADISMVMSLHSDGSTSMTFPGASVTLSTRRTTSITGGGEYEMGDIIGKGGMGVVYLARQASLDRRIVVKKIRDEYAARLDAQEKFITEALATGSLDHPNVVPIHDMGMGNDGFPFYVMKEVRGKTWREIMPTLSEQENIEILQRVADAVACAHGKGIIHRDLKPDNVMIGDYGEVLVMDWGLAAAVMPNAKAAPLTAQSARAGTPTYMAPEMARGLTHDIGPWSDQYLLGGMLFAVLTGRPPHSGVNAEEAIRNAANNIINDSDRNDEWMNVALRAMMASPQKRYPSVKAFQKALRDCQLHGESIAMSRQGEALLEKAAKANGYDEYSRAVFAFEGALELWKKNTAATERLADTRLAYARRALANGDYDLVLSLVEGAQEGPGGELAQKARKERAAREARRRRVKVFGAVAVGALVLVAVVSGIASVIISRQAEAERRAKEEAVVAKGVAEEQRGIAVEQKAEADRQRGVAEEQRRKAEDALVAEEAARRAEAEAQASRIREQEERLRAEERARQEAENARQKAEEALAAREEIARIGYLEDNSRWRFDAETAVGRQNEGAAAAGVPVKLTLEVPGAPIELAFIPSGQFVMGSPPRDPSRNNDEYLHEVDISRPFHLGVKEVTRRQWRAVVGMEKIESFERDKDEDEAPAWLWRVRPIPETEAELPATGVSFDDIEKLFLPRLRGSTPAGWTLRLPSEAEWEWAARAGTPGHYYTGDGEKALDACGWYEVNSAGRPHVAGRKTPNAWGLYDIIGNAAELTLDAYDSLYYLRAPRTDPVNDDAESTSRICRGGSYLNSPRLCRLSHRTWMHRANRYPNAGFRLAAIRDGVR